MTKSKRVQNPISVTHPDLVKEWDYEKNAPKTPDQFTFGSNQKVMWKCPKGHSYPSTIKNRATHNSGCPICSGQQVLAGYNDLQTLNPDLAKEWDYEKNYPLKPTEVVTGTHKKVWWRCDKDHSWPAEIKSRVSGCGCPYCSGQKVIIGETDLETCNPELAKEWDYEKNYPLKPNEVSVWCHKKIWWKCNKGHSWHATISHRSRGHGCTICSGYQVLSGYNDLQTLNPELAKEWDYEKNYPLRPDMLTVGSHNKIWWKCKNGHSWSAAMNGRTRGRGCPYCSNKKVLVGYNDLATTHPDIAKEWNYEKNGGLKPQDFTYSANTKVWWRCRFGHEWPATMNSRSQGSGCPACARAGSSMPEQGVVFYLSKVARIETRVKLFGKEIDVYLPDYSIGIEYDGIYWHKERTSSDIEKDRLLEANGIHLFRLIESDKESVDGNRIFFIYTDSYSNYNKALKQLCELLAEATGDLAFNNIDIDYLRDRLKIREKFDLYEKTNSLAVKYPGIAKEWNYERNGVFTPEMFYPSAKEKVWWKCSNGHEWQSTISNRVRGSKCRQCFADSLGKKVMCIETNEIYSSVMNAARSCGLKSSSQISLCCNGKRKTAGGYHWKYVDE